MQCCQAKVSKIIEQNFHSNLTRILIFQQFNFLQQIWYYEKARRSYSTLGYIETNLYVKGTYKTGAYSFLAALGLDEFIYVNRLEIKNNNCMRYIYTPCTFGECYWKTMTNYS